MKTTKLLDTIERLGLHLPESGSGRNGRILSSDLENVITAHYAKQHIERCRECGCTAHGFSMRRALGDVQLALTNSSLPSRLRLLTAMPGYLKRSTTDAGLCCATILKKDSVLLGGTSQYRRYCLWNTLTRS